MTSKEIELAVVNYFGARENLIVPNVSWGFLEYEADMIVVTKSGYAKEVEIKISRSDLVRDKKKDHTHNSNKLKELYFAIPEKLLKDKSHIPEKAGILVCKKTEYNGNTYYTAKLERPAISNGGEPLSLKEKFDLARLGTLRIWNLKRKLLETKKL